MWAEGHSRLSQLSHYRNRRYFSADGLANQPTSSVGIGPESFFRLMDRLTSEIPAQPICPEKQFVKQDPNFPKVDQMNSKTLEIWAITSQHHDESLPKNLLQRSSLHLRFREYIGKGKTKDQVLMNNLKTQNVKSDQTWSKSKDFWAVDSLPSGETFPKRSP